MNMKIKFIIVLWLFSIAICSGLTGYIVYNTVEPEIIVEKPEIKPVIVPPVKRKESIKGLFCKEIEDHLWHYDNDPMKIDWVVLEQNNQFLKMQIRGNLYERTFIQDASVNISIAKRTNQNWKIGLGIGIGAALVIGGGVLAYKLFK